MCSNETTLGAVTYSRLVPMCQSPFLFPSSVCNQLFINRYIWPEGLWQRLAAALADNGGVLSDYVLFQIEMIDPSRAPLCCSPRVPASASDASGM